MKNCKIRTARTMQYDMVKCEVKKGKSQNGMEMSEDVSAKNCKFPKQEGSLHLNNLLIWLRKRFLRWLLPGSWSSELGVVYGEHQATLPLLWLI